ncbi:KTSC domain-containing protein [Enterovirga sp. CN4-39]|uniref:KTSC domain-containing protein n=1 Tax=Enterovirga sp. CN4-39 TaxID=3400910 RepID=UPI003C05CDF5
MREVESSAVKAVDHDARRRELTVTFASGARYAYSGVTEETYEALLRAESVGRFVNLEIKPRFPARRLSGRSGSGPRSAA